MRDSSMKRLDPYSNHSNSATPNDFNLDIFDKTPYYEKPAIKTLQPSKGANMYKSRKELEKDERLAEREKELKM